MLVARDEQSCLVVSYKDIKQCIESAFLYVFSFLIYSWDFLIFLGGIASWRGVARLRNRDLGIGSGLKNM